MGKPLIENSPIVEYCYVKSIIKELRHREQDGVKTYFGYIGVVVELFDAEKKFLAMKSHEENLLPVRETPYTVAELMDTDEKTEEIVAALKKQYADYPPEAV